MVSDQCESNYATISGKVSSKSVYSHDTYGEGFFYFYVDVKRLSGSYDTIPVMVSDRLVKPEECTLGREVFVDGQFRSYNQYVDGRSKLMLMVFARDIVFDTQVRRDLLNLPDFSWARGVDEEGNVLDQDVNYVELVGYICKKPIYRKTPFDREISDLLIAVNRMFNRSDYIPCISWGRTARFCSTRGIGDRVRVYGRIQSRIYQKRHLDETVEDRVAYEVSIVRLELLESASNTKREPAKIRNLDEERAESEMF